MVDGCVVTNDEKIVIATWTKGSKSSMERAGLMKEVELVIGAPVMVMLNIHMELDIANGVCVSRDIFTMPHSRLLLFWPIPTIPTFVRLLLIQTSTSVDLDEYSVKSHTPEMSANSCS